MPDTTLEEAKRCPKCGMPGEEVSRIPHKDSRNRPCIILNMRCANGNLADPTVSRCTWFNTNWVIQLNEDGTIPTRLPGPKEFDYSDLMETMGRHYLENLPDDTQGLG